MLWINAALFKSIVQLFNDELNNDFSLYFKSLFKKKTRIFVQL